MTKTLAAITLTTLFCSAALAAAVEPIEPEPICTEQTIIPGPLGPRPEHLCQECIDSCLESMVRNDECLGSLWQCEEQCREYECSEVCE